MAFTYNLTGTGNELLISQVRLELGDTVEDDGVLPSGANLSDAEILSKLTTYSSDVEQATGALCTVLARHWARAADIAVGPRRENLSQVSTRWAELAERINPSYTSFSVGVQRSDGYSEYADDDTDSEYS